METKREKLITGKEGAPIKLDVASSWTKNYRDKHPGETISQFFGKEILETILAQEGCLGIRFYYANDHDGKKHLVIAGVMSDGSDQIDEKAHGSGQTFPKIFEIGDQSAPCPGSPGCPKNSLSDGQ